MLSTLNLLQLSAGWRTLCSLHIQKSLPMGIMLLWSTVFSKTKVSWDWWLMVPRMLWTLASSFTQHKKHTIHRKINKTYNIKVSQTHTLVIIWKPENWLWMPLLSGPQEVWIPVPTQIKNHRYIKPNAVVDKIQHKLKALANEWLLCSHH